MGSDVDLLWVLGSFPLKAGVAVPVMLDDGGVVMWCLGVFCSVCLGFCKLLGLARDFYLVSGFCHGNQNLNECCFLLFKQKCFPK